LNPLPANRNRQTGGTMFTMTIFILMLAASALMYYYFQRSRMLEHELVQVKDGEITPSQITAVGGSNTLFGELSEMARSHMPDKPQAAAPNPAPSTSTDDNSPQPAQNSAPQASSIAAQNPTEPAVATPPSSAPAEPAPQDNADTTTDTQTAATNEPETGASSPRPDSAPAPAGETQTDQQSARETPRARTTPIQSMYDLNKGPVRVKLPSHRRDQ